MAQLSAHLYSKKVRRLCQYEHWLHAGHCQIFKKAKGCWSRRTKPTPLARNSRNRNLACGTSQHSRNLVAVTWAKAVQADDTANTNAKETASHILIEQSFRKAAGIHATTLACMCIVLLILFSVATSALFYTSTTSIANSHFIHNDGSEVSLPILNLLPKDIPCSSLQLNVNNNECSSDQGGPANLGASALSKHNSTSPGMCLNQLPSASIQIGHTATSVASNNGEAPDIAAQQALLELRNAHWDLVSEANSTGDHKEYTKSKEWRASISAAHSALLHAVSKTDAGPLCNVTQIIRSFHPGRALPCTNPEKLAMILQPAIDEGHISQQQVHDLVEIARNGISAAEFRDLDGPALDLSDGNTTDPIEEDILLDFYFSQVGKGRVLIFPQTDAEYLESLSAVVISPSFLAYAEGKAPRPILNLSSQNNGVNQRMDDLEPETNGYTTIPKIAEQTVFKYVDMVQHPEKYGITDVHKIDLAMFVADASDAFYRLPISPHLVGVQCARVAGYTIVPMCCTFGWKRSAEAFSHITASILAVHKSNMRNATVLKKGCEPIPEDHTVSPNFGKYTTEQATAWRKLADEVFPDHINCSSGHVDDFSGLTIVDNDAAIGAAADLVFAITSHLGMDSVSAKKFAQSSFWSSLQKIIGAWFDVENFTVTMPHDKIQQVIDLLESPDFAPDKSTFSIEQCASLRGKLRWALYATKMGDSAALINIEKQRKTNQSAKIKVKPVRHGGETQEKANAKFHNDLHVYKLLMYACRDNPRIASCSMASVLPLQQRLSIPGQSKWLVWLSGDFSIKAQSFGIEMWHPDHGEIRRYAIIEHPPEVIAAFREAAAGNATKGEAIISSVLERQNKAMAEWQFRKLIAGRPCIVLEDNQGSVCTINAGYANNVHLQTMQMASNLRQAIDEAPMEAFYTQTENMGIYDKSSRLDFKFIADMNKKLAKHNMPLWEQVDPTDDVRALSQWLAEVWTSKIPMLDELLACLGNVSAIPNLPPVSLNPDELLQPVDNAWQKRVSAAAVQIPDSLGSFGPMAYSIEHLQHAPDAVSGCEYTWKQLRKRNDRLATSPNYTMFDAYHGGCGGTVAAIRAGIFVKAGADIVDAEVRQFEKLTGRTSLGDVGQLLANRIPNVHIWFSCSSCKDFCPLGSKKGAEGSKGGDQFCEQFTGAEAAKAKVVVIENVDGVASLHDGAALKMLQQHAKKCGYSKFYSKCVNFSEHGDPENRSRRVIVAFHDSVNLVDAWQFPMPTNEHSCAGEYAFPSFKVPERFWDTRKWYRTAKTWCSKTLGRIYTLGFKYGKDRIGNPAFPARVWHPSGLFPTVLASGNAGIFRWPRLRAMCPIREAFATWSGKPPQTFHPLGCVHERRPMPIECLIAKGFPADTPFDTDEDGFRFAGNAVPPSYFTQLFLQVTDVLDKAEVDMVLERKVDEYCTYNDQPLHAHDIDITARIGAPRRVKMGQNYCHRLNRDKLTNVPVKPEELKLMSDRLDFCHVGRLAKSSKKDADLGWRHWLSFCSRFKKPIFLPSETQAERSAAAAQAQLFLIYETACFDIKASSVAAKIWAVGVAHKAAFQADPFSRNALVKSILDDACALDEPAKQKLPITNTTLKALRRKLDLSKRPQFCFWTGIRFAITFLCRISEWAFDDKYSVKWKYILFYTSDESPGGRRRINLTSSKQLVQIAEMQVIFFSDKTGAPGESKARSFWAIDDQTDSRCIVRDMARLWLISERNLEYDVFSWNHNTTGVKRSMVNAALKQAAIDTGIPGADVSSHSLRATGLSRLLNAKPASGGSTGMQWEQAKKFGRWKSDCALRYFWASNDLAKEYAASIWDAACFVRCKGNGDLQFVSDRTTASN